MIKKRLISLVILLVVALGAGGLVLWQRRHAQEQAEHKEKESKVLAVASLDDLTSLRLEDEPQVFVIERVEGGGTKWQLTEPIATRADDSTLDSLGRALVELKYKAKVPQAPGKPQDLSLFGLEPARFTVTMMRKDGSKETLLVGKKNSFDGSLYVQRQGAAEVLLVPGSISYQLETDLFRLRDKVLVHFDSAKVVRLTVEKEGKPLYAVEKQGEAYRIVAPTAFVVDADKVRSMLSSLSSLRAREFAVEKPTAADLARTALAKPALRVTIGFADPALASLTLRVGKAASGNEAQTYAMLEGGHPIAEVSGDSVTTQLDVTVDALRDKSVVHFDRQAVTGVTIEDGAGVTLEFVKVRDEDKDRDGWNMVKPKAVDAHDSALESLLYTLSTLKASEIVAEKANVGTLAQHGLGPTSKRVTLFGKDKQQLAQVVLGKAEGEKQYVMAAGGERLDAIDSARLGSVSFVESGYTDVAEPKPE
ncbi:MAG: DUF4340 domain-containing protein [Myxococcota bacterium]